MLVTFVRALKSHQGFLGVFILEELDAFLKLIPLLSKLAENSAQTYPE